MIRKKRQKRRTHLRCIKTNLKGILERKTKIKATISPKNATIRLGFNTIEIINKEKETSLTLGSQE